MPVTSLHATSGKHSCGEDTVSVEWDWGGKRHALWVTAKNGKCHFAGCPARKKPPDDPLVAYLMSDFGMKVPAARLLARRVPKGTEAERILAVHRLYEKEGK